jgi:hypothetical protein
MAHRAKFKCITVPFSQARLSRHSTSPVLSLRTASLIPIALLAYPDAVTSSCHIQRAMMQYS